MNKEQLYIAFDCDIWRGSDSMRLIGVFDEKHLLAYFRKNYKEFEKSDGEDEKWTRKGAYALTVKDLLDQKVSYLQVDTVTINEVL